MKIIVDADACPVKNEFIEVAKRYNLHVLLVMSIAHYSFNDLPEHVERIYVEKGADRADFKIIQLASAKDIVITQDYGLASLLLPKGCRVFHHQGYEYTKQRMDYLLERRHFSALRRQAGQRTKGPKAFTGEDRKKFKDSFEKFIQQITSL